MRLIRTLAMVLCWFAVLDANSAQPAPAPSRWAQPAAELAGQIAEILGPGQTQLTIRNLSTIPSSEIPAIRRLLEQDLRSHGVLPGGTESANTIRVTLSEDARERLWVTEVAEGSETQVAMVHVDAAAIAPPATTERMTLRRERVMDGRMEDNPVVAAAEVHGGLVVMYPDRISIFSKNLNGWTEASTFAIERKLGRDPRGVLLQDPGGSGFSAWVPGAECTGSYSEPLSSAAAGNGWAVRCHASDDPWPVYHGGDAIAAPTLKVFYNPARNFFTGVTTPSVGVDLPPFYAASMIPRAAGGAALLVAGIDGKVQMVENGALRAVAGTRDWGSDFAVVRSGCGGGTQIIASSSGQAATDSLRAFEIPALEAVPASNALAVEGTVTELWTAADGKSALAVVRNAANEYEVDRVTALCN